MTDYCFFTIEHPKARRVYIRGVADITEPIEDYGEIVRFGDYLSPELPSNPYKKGEKDHKLFEELKTSIKKHFEAICDELVFAKPADKAAEWENKLSTENYYIEFEKVII